MNMMPETPEEATKLLPSLQVWFTVIDLCPGMCTAGFSVAHQSDRFQIVRLNVILYASSSEVWVSDFCPMTHTWRLRGLTFSHTCVKLKYLCNAQDPARFPGEALEAMLEEIIQYRQFQ